MLSRLDKKTQLPLPNPEEVAKNEAAQKIANLKKKRLTLTLLLVGSISLSLIFWTYRSLKTKPLSFSLPQVKTSQSTGSISLNPELKQFLSQHPDIKSFYLKVTNPDSEFFYGEKPSLIPGLEQVNSRLTTIDDSPLPESLVYKELVAEKDIVVGISTPGRNFLLYLNSNNANILKPDLPKITSLSYWSVFGN